ncbi:MAG: AMP-binding protein [Lewinellaceae bacterium]|nr:AMP-binding protein [Saprospiraceae bacterium]MCB9341295.1 AMP-binding protein [Lewinellaceae bacterium]
MEHNQPSVVEILSSVAKANANKLAIVDKSDTTTFGKLELAVRKTARYLTEKGIQRQDRVLVLVPLSIDLYRVTLALNYIGAAAIFVEDWITFQQIGACCEAAKPKAVVTHWKGLIYSWLKPALRRIPLKINLAGYANKAPLEVAPQLRPEDEAIVSFTSGTSAVPKMLVRDFQFLNHQFYTLREVKQSRSDEVELLTLPAFLFLNLAMGSTSVLADFNKLKPDHFEPQKIAQQIVKHKVNSICASPSFLLKLCNAGLDAPIKSTIKNITTGGAPVFPGDAAQMTEHFPNAKITVIYGSSEAEPISVADGVALATSTVVDGLFAGQIHPETEVRIMQIAEKQPVGEILVTGPNVVLKGEQNKVVVDGKKWHRTGDSGYLAENGALYLTGPIAALVDCEGQLWSPFIFEGLANKNEAVTRATLVKVGSQLIAAVVAKKGGDKNRIKNDLMKLAVPFDKVVFLDSFPYDHRHGGKIKYTELEQLIKVKLPR